MENVRKSQAPWFMAHREDEETNDTVHPFECKETNDFQFPTCPTFVSVRPTFSFDEYVKSPHFKEEEDLASRIYGDLKRRYATFNGENLVERAWRNLNRSDFTSYFDASQALYLQKEWEEIEKAVRREFVERVFPAFVKEACRGMEPDIKRAFLGSFHQGSGTIFFTLRQLDRGGALPFRTMENMGKVIQYDLKTLFIYEATLGEQLFVNNEGGMELQYGPLAERLVGGVDFTSGKISIQVSSFSNPLYGQEIPRNI